VGWQPHSLAPLLPSQRHPGCFWFLECGRHFDRRRLEHDGRMHRRCPLGQDVRLHHGLFGQQAGLHLYPLVCEWQWTKLLGCQRLEQELQQQPQQMDYRSQGGSFCPRREGSDVDWDRRWWHHGLRGYHFLLGGDRQRNPWQSQRLWGPSLSVELLHRWRLRSWKPQHPESGHPCLGFGLW